MAQRMSGMESLWPGRVTQVIDPHYFWMQLGTRESLTRFEKLQRDMQEYGRLHFQCLGEADTLEYGHVVLVDTGDSGSLRFKRGQVARITSGNSVDIFYVDYGNTELTTIDKIMSYMPDVFKTCMPQAVRCSLAGVRPISKNWTTRGTRTFQLATDGLLLYTLVLHGEPGYCEVALYLRKAIENIIGTSFDLSYICNSSALPDMNIAEVIQLLSKPYERPSLRPTIETFDSEDARSIAHFLLDEEVAMPKDGKEVPEFVRDIPDFMALYMTRVYSDKMKTDDGYQMSPKQEPVTIETSNNLQIPAPPTSPGSSPPSNGRTSEKYVPPGRKYQEKSPRSAGSQLEGSPASHSSVSSSPGQGSTVPAKPGPQHTPVVDFFPFDNVSTYPPTPVSPVKSPGRSSNASGSQESSYFSRSPSKYDHPDQQQYRGYHANGQSYRGRTAEGYHGAEADSYYRNSTEGTYRKPAEHHHNHHHHHHHERSRFAANFDNLPSSNTEDAVSGKASAAANLEPHYLNKIAERNGQYASGDASQTSPISSQSRHTYINSPSRPIQNSANAMPPFYPPKQTTDIEAGPPQPVSLTTPQYYHAKNAQPEGYSKHSKDLMPPGFYQSHKSLSPGKQSEPYYQSSGDSYANIGKYQYTTEGVSSQPMMYSSDGQYSGIDYGYKYGDSDTGHNQQRQKHQYYRQGDDKTGYYADPHPTDYDHPSAPGAYNHQASRYADGAKVRPGIENNSNTRTRPPRPHVNMPPNQTPTKSDMYNHQKMSPASPESPGIAGFNVSDLEHTKFASADMFHQRMYQENLKVLQEETEDLAAESKEQSQLAEMARYGSLNDGEGQDYRHPVDHEVFDQISEDISFVSRENEELKNSPVKHYREPSVPNRPVKLEGMPPGYMADIDFTEAVKEALDFAKTDGIENAKALLDSVVESLRSARVEKQLFDVLLMLLSKAIHDYELFHAVVMDTISRLNTEMEIKEPLAKALKRQQDLCVQVPVRKNPHHQDYSRVMGALYNLAQDWSDSNATIQDSILVTVEKWILFNNKGSQIGQTDKENVFLDCFVAFWEVSGSQLLQHNDSFRSRLQEDVKQKLLHEKVSRPIRERLLDILLESFMGGANVRTAKEEAFTQTPRKTMIPSSCQVKPSAREISTMTETDWTDDYSGYDPDDTRWYTATDFNSLEVSLNLRPMGQRSKVAQLSSTPDDKVKTSKNRSSLGGTSLNSPQGQDQSYASSAADMEYATPNSSYVFDKVGVNSADNSSNYPSSAALQHNVCDSVQAKDVLKVNSAATSSGARTSQAGRRALSERKTVCETKSASGKTIVDWFDYQPETETSNSGAKATGTKPETGENLKHVKNTLDTLSLNSIEEKYSVITKGKSNAETIGNSAKSRKREKKETKWNQMGSTVAQDSGSPEGKDKATEVSVKAVDGLSEAAGAAEDGDSVKDWWGAEDDLESKMQKSKHGACEIHMDVSPDVIIEDEFIEDVISKDKFQSQEADISDKPVADEAIAAGNSSESQSPLSQSDDVKQTQSTDISQDSVSSAKKDDGGVKVTESDVYGFSEEMSDDNWESDNAEGFDVDEALINNENLTHNLEVNDNSAKGEPGNAVTAVGEVKEEYSRNFPQTNLGDYIRPALGDSSSPEPVSRWKPKRRICLTCHDESHKTENCPKGIFLLQ